MNSFYMYLLTFILGVVISEISAFPIVDPTQEVQASYKYSPCHTYLDQYLEMVEMMEYANPNEYCSILEPMREYIDYMIDNCEPFLPDMNFANAEYLREIDDAIKNTCQ